MRPRPWAITTLIALALIGSGGCTWRSQGKSPAWVQDPSSHYPADTFLVGLGRGDSNEAAVERAYGAVAKIFKAEVSLQSKDWESFLLFENRGTSQTERRLTLDQVTRVSTDKVLENAKVLETWQDRAKGVHYALAGINRAQAGTALAERIADLDRAVEAALRESRRSPDVLARVKAMRRAVKDVVLREAHNADLRVIRPSGHGLPAAYSVRGLTAELEELLRTGVAIRVDLQGDQADGLRQAVIEGLLREGLPVTMTEAPTGQVPPEGALHQPLQLLVRGAVRLSKVEVPDPRFKYVRWCTDLTVVETGSQRVIGAVSGGGREGHLTEEEAAAKAVRIMQAELTTGLVKTLAGFVYGDPVPPEKPQPAGCSQEEGGNKRHSGGMTNAKARPGPILGQQESRKANVEGGAWRAPTEAPTAAGASAGEGASPPADRGGHATSHRREPPENLAKAGLRGIASGRDSGPSLEITGSAGRTHPIGEEMIHGLLLF